MNSSKSSDSMKISVFSCLDFGSVKIFPKELQNELLCDTDKKYSFSKFIYNSGFIIILIYDLNNDKNFYKLCVYTG